MSESFSEDEIAAFRTRFARSGTFSDWQRVTGRNGLDVLCVHIAGRHPTTVRLAKDGRAGYLASGAGGWGLTVCASFDELLDTLETLAANAA